MKKIGFIDYFLDEWHANNYPAMIRELSGGDMEVQYAYAHIPAPEGRISNEQWSENNNIKLVATIEELIEKSDYIIVLSPDNPEMHEELCDLPLKSGKRVYVDKTFAEDVNTAVRIFENADIHNTPCYSSSALRFASELDGIDTGKIDKIYSEGPASLEIYSIHQIEMIVRLMDNPAKRVMFTGNKLHPSYLIEFEDGRTVQCYHRDDPQMSFVLNLIDKENKCEKAVIKSDYFRNFIKALITFFRTGNIPVSHNQTIDVIAIRQSVITAAKAPYKWIEIRK